MLFTVGARINLTPPPPWPWFFPPRAGRIFLLESCLAERSAKMPLVVRQISVVRDWMTSWRAASLRRIIRKKRDDKEGGYDTKIYLI